MKFVTLVVAAMIVSFSASSQTTHRAAPKSTVQKQQKTKSGKAKPSRTKSSAAKTDEAITLTDEKAHKAKWTFEEMLKRRLQIDAEDGVTVQGKD
ncbi:hypothetical protein [Flavisolibacter ginsenosidimutans]|uniref:Uncharacterized protein n=1 Tax=Flavisolibacter ginsenosidimutans TaxID=661481 RepID=A0A5B8UIM4_9BACT|nr:hypothetical protein [Flavisolibacter ginsenosidimutans]QEC56418.1 hypothetical protein FSB75_11115 [Flavisolibacter ginsenosidimutans]